MPAYVVRLTTDTGREYRPDGMHMPGRWDGLCLLQSHQQILTTLAVRYGLGQHGSTVSLDDRVSGLKALYVAIILYNSAMSFTKYSILLQYWRV